MQLNHLEIPLACRLPLRISLRCIVTMMLTGASAGLLRAGETADAERLTNDGFLKRDLHYWPESDDLLYTVESPDGNMRVMRRNGETGETAFFQPDSGISDREITVSQDGLVSAVNMVSGLSSWIVVDDRVRGRKVTMPQMGKHPWANWPCVSPDGTVLLYVEGAKVMYAYDLVGNRGKESVTRLTPDSIGPASDYWPRFSPDGTKIAFGSNRDQDFEIYEMNRDGTGQRRLTHSAGIDMRPVYSPDGQSICFTSNRDGNYEIYVMRADGSQIERVTTNSERDDFAIWSPDGKSLVYVSERNGRFDIYRRPWH
jgi:WD40 repeat protein